MKAFTIAERAAELSLTRTDLSRASKVHYNTISRFFRTEQLPLSILAWKLISDALGISIDDLLSDTPPFVFRISEYHISQNKLSKKSGVIQASISRYTRATKLPMSIQAIVSVSKVLDCTVASLIRIPGPEFE